MDYTMARAAQAVGTSKSAIHRAIKAGRLSATKGDDGTYRIDGAELARVYPPSRAVTVEPSPWHTATHPDTAAEAQSETLRDGRETVIETRIEVEVLRARLEATEALLARERETAEIQLSRERETVDDLRKRLDRSEERVLALTAQPVPQPTPEVPAVVDELRRRLEEAEARNKMLSAVVAPQWAGERPREAPATATPPKGTRGFLGRLLGR